MQPAKIIRNRAIGATKVEALREAFASVPKVDPSSDTYKDLCRFLDDRTNQELQELAQEQIRFVSVLAQNRCILRGIATKPQH